MKYRGLSPIQLGTIWVIFMVAVGAVVGATGPRAVSALADLSQVAPSRLPWVATRVVAFLSYFAITGSVVYGLLLSTKILDAIAHRPVSFSLHQDLAAIGFGLAGIHGALLGLDATDTVMLLLTLAFRPAGRSTSSAWSSRASTSAAASARGRGACSTT